MGALCCKPEVVDFDAPVDLYHFYLLRAVGKGAFGKVRVVQHKQTKALYALKYINKAKCVKMKAVSNIIQERRLLEEIDTPFVCNLRYAFQDDENLFMVLDLMLGGDLRFHLDRNGSMKEEVVRFYVAELACALDYLHHINIAHRDIKPDNVLLDDKGHVHLTDFNIAVHFSPKRPLTSVAGSMAYMAPEIIAKRGYLSSVDWWSLGVMAYELLFGRRPFRGRTNTALQHSIMNDRCSFPDNVETAPSREAMSCIKSLLDRDFRKRLGCKNGLEDFKSHPWFEGMDWDRLMAKEIQPPFEPDSKKANFDATHELEELLLEDNPLKARKRDEKRDINTLSPELRQMEDHFLPFDHLKQERRSYFKSTRSTQGEQDTQQTRTVVYGLADQPNADMTSMTQLGLQTVTGAGGLASPSTSMQTTSFPHSAGGPSSNSGMMAPPSAQGHHSPVNGMVPLATPSGGGGGVANVGAAPHGGHPLEGSGGSSRSAAGQTQASVAAPAATSASASASAHQSGGYAI